MSETNLKRKSAGNERSKKKKYRSDGTPIWGKRHVEGPGVWVSCVKGKEKQTIGEIYDLFDSVASEIWPIEETKDGDGDESDKELSLEAQIAKEVSTIKRPRTEQRFANCHTDTPCVIFISCKPPVDPVELVVKYIKSVQATGVTRTRHTHRLVPVSATCTANIPEIKALCDKVFQQFFDKHGGRKFSYKIELRVRNHTTITRQTLIQHVAQWVPEGHTVSLDNPEIFVLVEIFKSICGVSIVQDYYSLQKFNVIELASTRNKKEGESIEEQ